MTRTKEKIVAFSAGTLLIVAGALLFYFGFYNHAAPQSSSVPATALEPSSEQQAVAPVQVPAPVTGEGTPQHLELSDAAISIPVAKGYYNAQTRQWTLGNNAAYFATMTASPNTKAGNTFIYGHNRNSVFSRLAKLKVGSIAVVTTSANERFTYRLRGTHTTTPEDASVLNYHGAPILTLQTCSGAFFQNRTMYIFDLVEASHV